MKYGSDEKLELLPRFSVNEKIEYLKDRGYEIREVEVTHWEDHGYHKSDYVKTKRKILGVYKDNEPVKKLEDFSGGGRNGMIESVFSKFVRNKIRDIINKF